MLEALDAVRGLAGARQLVRLARERTITVGTFRYLSARNICSPPSASGVRMSASPTISMSGVLTRPT